MTDTTDTDMEFGKAVPVPDYPGVVYDQERDVMADKSNDNAPVLPSTDNSAVADMSIRAAALEAARSINGPSTTITDLLLNASKVEAYLRGEEPSQAPEEALTD